jgi:hypothetical protein
MSWPRLRWPLLLFAFIALPLAAAFGDPAIFQLFGNGSYLPSGSTGEHVLRWWDSWGRPASVAVAAWLVLSICRVSLVKSTVIAAGSAAATYFWWFAVVLVALALHPDALS